MQAVTHYKSLRNILRMFHPENHQSLTIRVAGYTAYFVELAGKLQDEIIERTTYESI